MLPIFFYHNAAQSLAHKGFRRIVTPPDFWLEFSHLDGQCFQIFLDNLAAEYPEHLNVVQLDNGKFYHSSQLKIPDNILLVFQPPYSPELNPIERVGQYIKQELSWGLYDNL